MDSLLELAKKVKIEEIFLNNLVSFDDPLSAAQWCLTLKGLTGAKLTIPIHDYFCICPSYTLVDDQGKFCGIPELSRCRDCLRNMNREEFCTLVDYRDIDRWRSAWSGVLKEADSILCFSHSSVKLLNKAYPFVDLSKIEVLPLPVDPLRKVQLEWSGPLHIGVAGHIYSPAKGSGIIKEMVRIIHEQHLPIQMTIFGTMEVPIPSSHYLRLTGPYKREELPDIIEKSGANIFFLPSIWPETFSYVTAELMQMGVPLAAFDIGAPAERLRTYPLGLVISKIEPQHALQALMDFHGQLIKKMNNLPDASFASQA